MVQSEPAHVGRRHIVSWLFLMRSVWWQVLYTILP